MCPLIQDNGIFSDQDHPFDIDSSRVIIEFLDSFKDLDEEEFEVIWGRLYRSYYKEELTYSKITDIPNEQYIEASY